MTIAKNAKINAAANFNNNVVDPFSAVFEMAGFNMQYDEWIKGEEVRKAQKTQQNHMGNFHQIILGSCNNWANMKIGKIMDLLNVNKKIIAEVKNKHNTVKFADLSNSYWSYEAAVMNKMSVYKGYTVYHVSIIPNNPLRYNKVFTPSDKEKGQKCPSNKLIRKIDGASFYEIVTGDPAALENLFNVLPAVIADITRIDVLDRQRLKGLFQMAYG